MRKKRKENREERRKRGERKQKRFIFSAIISLHYIFHLKIKNILLYIKTKFFSPPFFVFEVPLKLPPSQVVISIDRSNLSLRDLIKLV